MAKEVFEAMQQEKPYATYKKTIIGKLAVRYLDPLRGTEAIEILKGDPSKSNDGILFSVWSFPEDRYLRQNNKEHLERGRLIPIDTPGDLELDTTNMVSDEEIEKILLQPHFALKNKLATFTSTVPVQRFLLAAEKLNRPVKTIQYIKEVLSQMEQKVPLSSSIDRIDVEH